VLRRSLEDRHQSATPATTGTLLFPWPARRRAERMLRHAHGLKRRSGVGVAARRHNASETQTFDDDGTIILWMRFVEGRALLSASRHLVSAPDVVAQGIGLRLRRGRHDKRKRDRATDRLS